MIGFYIVTCDADREAKFNDGRGGLLGETSFVPMHEGTLLNKLALSVGEGAVLRPVASLLSWWSSMRACQYRARLKYRSIH